MNQASSETDPRLRTSLIVAIVGLILLVVMVVALAILKWSADDIATLGGIFTGILGTLVGAILGFQVGSAGKKKAERLARLAIEALPPDKAKEIMRSV